MEFIYQNIEDVTVYLVGADLTTDGVAYSDETTTTTADTAVTIYRYIFQPDRDYRGDVIWVYFDITATLKAKNATTDVKMKMQIRNKLGTWQDLFSEVTYADINTTYTDKSYSGYLVLDAENYCTPGDSDLWTYFNEVPFDFRVQIEANEVNGGYGKLKNTSYIRVIYKRKMVQV